MLEQEAVILCTCPKGVPPILRAELEALGMPSPKELRLGVETSGNLQDCMKLNLHLRTAHRVLLRLTRFRAAGPGDLYKSVRRLPWEKWLKSDGYISISSSVRNEMIRDTRFANVKVKDAIADYFNELVGHRPDSGPEQGRGASIFLHWEDKTATLYMDTTGEPLPRRGYRKMPHKAPMQETLAAACVLSSNWKDVAEKGGNFIAPMCGSGTLGIEAAQIALNRAPGMDRDFAFMRLLEFDKAHWNELKAAARKAEKDRLPGRIILTDNDADAVQASMTNAEAARVESFLEFRQCDFRETEVPEGEGTVMLNPEYGLRLGDESTLGETYKAIGDFFKQKCNGYMGYIFTGNLKLAKRVGLRTSRRVELFNAKIECRLLEYELYGGTRK